MADEQSQHHRHDQSDSPLPFLARLNGLQRASVENLRETLRGAHYTNVLVRAGGRDHHFEADWLRQALDILCTRRDCGARPAEFTRCAGCVSHELTRDVCWYEGRCLRPPERSQ